MRRRKQSVVEDRQEAEAVEAAEAKAEEDDVDDGGEAADEDAAKEEDLSVEEVAPGSVRAELIHETPGAPPGTLLIDDDSRPDIRLVDYDVNTVREHPVRSLDEIARYLEDDRPTVTWIDVRGIGHRETFERLGQIFQLHPLALEDVVNVPQRPKTDQYPTQQLLVTRMVNIDERGELVTEQLSILFGKGFVLTVQEEPRVDCLDPVRQRIRSGRGNIRKSGADYLAYAIFDAVIDGFYPVLESYGERLEELELRVSDLDRPTGTSTEIFQLKRDLLTLRRAIWPQRDLLSSLLRDQSPHISAETRIYLRDTYDHAVQVMDMVETFREIASGLMDLYMTGVSHRLNEVMKVLTILSTIFLPMTFIAGVYGMNFDTGLSPLNMPELKWFFGYPFSLVLMAVSAGTLLLYYRSKGWIGAEGSWGASPARRIKKILRRRARSTIPPPPAGGPTRRA
jgi:magnesium transporter